MNTHHCNSQHTSESSKPYTKLSTRPYSKVTTPLYNSVTSKDYNLANLVRNALSDPDLSNGASRILVQIILSAGRKGYVHFLISTLCTLGKMGRTRCKECLSELQEKNRIRIVHRPGRSSEYQVIGIFQEKRKVSRSSDLIKQYSRKELKTVSKPEPASPNVFCLSSQEEQQPEAEKTTHHKSDGKICSPDPGEKLAKMAELPKMVKTHEQIRKISRTGKSPKNSPQVEKIQEIPDLEKGIKKAGPAPQRKRQPAIRFDLVRQILELTRDHKSLGFWIKLVRNVDPETICYLLSSLRLAMSSGQVESPGRYLVGICKRVCPEVFEIQSKKQALRPSQQQMHGQLHSNQAQSEPVKEPDYAVGLLEIRKIRMMLEGVAA